MTEVRNHDLAQRMAELARAAAAPRSVEEVLSDVTATAKELIPGVDTAGVLLVGQGREVRVAGGHLRTASQTRRSADEVSTKGPCVQAALDDLIVRTEDFRTEERWPQYSPAAVELGVLSGLSFKLYTADRTAGALNLFAFKPNAFDGEDETDRRPSLPRTPRRRSWPAARASSCSRRCPPGTASARPRASSWSATASTTCGRSRCCKRLSQDSNTRLADIAQRVIDTRSSHDGQRAE